MFEDVVVDHGDVDDREESGLILKNERLRSITWNASQRQIQVNAANVAERARKTKSDPSPRLLFESTAEKA